MKKVENNCSQSCGVKGPSSDVMGRKWLMGFSTMSKPHVTAGKKKIIYSRSRWRLLERFRRSASLILSALEANDIRALVHGSVARGDVDEGSDVDVIIPRVVPSYRIELALSEFGIEPTGKEIVMATPWQLPKAHISLGENRFVSFPLIKPKRLELEFYRFGGAVELSEVEKGERVPGIGKRLLLIEPTEKGHCESQVIGREGEVAKRVGVSIDIVKERVQVLTRRSEIGRTGVFLQRELSPDENFESVLKQIAESNPEVKRRFKEK